MDSAHATTLLERCHHAAAACDLEIGLPVRSAELADEVRAAIDAIGPDQLVSGRAIWNLLWVAADLTTWVDLYRAEALLVAVRDLHVRRFAVTLRGPRQDERADEHDAADMSFDFFFNRADQPLVALRLDSCLDVLGAVLRIENRHCQHAALHGLGHLRQQVPSEARVNLVEGVLDRFLSRTVDSGLREYATLCRRGAVS